MSLILGAYMSWWPDLFKPYRYLLGAAFILAFLMAVVPIIYTVVIWGKSKRDFQDQESPLEIIFEPLNPDRQFWSMEAPRDAYGRIIKTVWEHRVLIRNQSDATLRNISVMIERSGAIPDKPHRGLFIRTQKDACDLQPGCGELIAIIESPINKKTPIGGIPGFAYGPIKITASADDVSPAVRWFDFDWQSEQGLFSRD